MYNRSVGTIEPLLRAAGTFEESLTDVFAALVNALQDVIGSTGVGADVPQELARRLGINRNLTWKISKLVCTPDPYEALQHLPGDEGLEILLAAAGRQGVSGERLAAVREARRALDRVVEVHAGDQSTLDLMLDGMSGSAGARLEQSRRLAFRGNSGIWGVQARTRVTMIVLAPSREDPALLDSARVAGFIDLRRLRPGVRWPIFGLRRFHDDGTPIAVDQGRETGVDPAYDTSAGPKLIGDLCTGAMTEVKLVRDRLGWVYELGEGPVGNTGLCTCFFGTIDRGGVPRYRSDSDRVGELYSEVNIPTESLQFDLFLHRGLEYAAGGVRSLCRGTSQGLHANAPAVEIPLGERAVELLGRPPAVHSPIMPRYEELVNRTFARGGWDRRDFVGYRLTVGFPPMFSSVIMRFDLPSAPGGD